MMVVLKDYAFVVPIFALVWTIAWAIYEHRGRKRAEGRAAELESSRREREALRTLREAMDRLWHEANHWHGENIVNLVWTHSFPDNDSFSIANEQDVLSAAARVGGDTANLVREAFRAAQTVQTRLAQLRSLQNAVDSRAVQHHQQPFEEEVASARTCAERARDRIVMELQRLGE